MLIVDRILGECALLWKETEGLDIANTTFKRLDDKFSVECLKVAGVANPADLLTKHLGLEVASSHLSRLNCWPREGRAALAPHL